jgi:hypothetical protein
MKRSLGEQLLCKRQYVTYITATYMRAKCSESNLKTKKTEKKSSDYSGGDPVIGITVLRVTSLSL